MYSLKIGGYQVCNDKYLNQVASVCTSGFCKDLDDEGGKVRLET